jgi:Calcineurin-like phosphoesterase
MPAVKVSHAVFAEIYNDIQGYPSLADVARKLNLDRRQVSDKVRKMRASRGKGLNVPELIRRSTAHPPLMSESSEKFHEQFTAEDCVVELRRLAEAHPDKVITRNFFRTHADISESTWNRHFGTFEEFKRQANIKLSRQAHALERTIAVHASRDHYRAIGADRVGYEGKYERPSHGRYKAILVGSDLHDKECDPFWLRTFIDTAKRLRPDVICLNGDIFDLPEFGKYSVDPRDWDVVGRIKYVHENILEPLREASPESQIDLIEGNHEARMLRMLADATPALRVLLSDLHGWSIPKLFGLDKYEVNYIARMDLAAFNKTDFNKELSKNYKNYYGCFIAHHFPHARNFGMPGWNGHHHRHDLWQNFNPQFGTFEWHQLGAGHRRMAEYCEGERWSNGFMIAHCDVDTHATAMEYIQLTNFAVVGGKFYSRTADEGEGNLAVWPGT